MADKYADRLADYVEVKDRLAVLYELYPQARITTTYELTDTPDTKPKVICRALISRTPDDPIPASGTSWMYLPGGTPYTRGSEIENAETSAVGRAIGLMGILIDRSIASANEIEGKRSEPKPEPVREPVALDEPVFQGPWSETGKLLIRRTGPADGELRQDPDGAYLIFVLQTVDAKTIQVLARGSLAEDIHDAIDGDWDVVATVDGDLYRVPWDKDGRKMPPYLRLNLAHIHTPSWDLPAPEPTAPMFDEAEIDAALEKVPK